MAGGSFHFYVPVFRAEAAWDRRSTPPPYPFNLAIAALASICSAAPKAPLSGAPFLSILGRSKSALRQKFPAKAANFVWTRPSARLASARKGPGTDGALLRLIPSTWRLQPWPPSARPPPKAPLSGDPVSLHSSGGVNPPSGKNSRPKPRILFGRALRRGSLPLSQRAWDRRSTPPPYPFNLAIAALAAICSASFLLCPLPRPATSPFRSTSTKKRLSWSGPSLASQAVLQNLAALPLHQLLKGGLIVPGAGQPLHLPAEDILLYDLPGRGRSRRPNRPQPAPASTASAWMEGRFRPPPASLPLPRCRYSPRCSASATSTRLSSHQGRPGPGQLPFGQIRVVAVQVVSHHHTQNRDRPGTPAARCSDACPGSHWRRSCGSAHFPAGAGSRNS